MPYRTLIAFTAVVALGCIPVTSSALAAGHTGGHGGGGRAGSAHVGGHAMGGHAHFGGAGGRRFAGGGHVRRGYGGGYDGGGYACNGYYNGYNGCGYDPGAAIVGGLIGGALNGFGAY